MKKTAKWLAALAAMMTLLAAGCDNGSSGEPEEPGLVYKDGWVLAGSTVRQYRGTETSVTTPEGVTRIGEHAFENCTGITAVTIGDGVTVIDDYAFYGCENLAEVTIPASVALIGSGAFSGCALDTVRYGGTIGQWCAVDGIGAVAWAEHVTMSGIQDLNGMEKLEIPDGTKTIAARALYYCEDLTDVTLPASVTRIGSGAFREYTALKELKFSGTKAQWQAIEGCDTVAVPGIQCSDGHLGVKDVPGYLKIYGTKVTGYTDGLPADLKIPDGVTEIEGRYFTSGVFYNCMNLTNLTIPASVTKIGSYAFYGCTSLASVTIPASVTEIGDSAFSYCNKLTDVTYGGTIAQWCAVDDVSDLMSYAEHVTMSDGTDLKQRATIVIPDGVTSIGWSAFYKCTNLTSVTIPGSVTEIGIYAFSGCTKLKELQFSGTKAQWQAIEGSDTVAVPGIRCSDGYLGVKDAPDYLIMVGTTVTGYADGLPANLVIPDGVTNIRATAFYDCTTLESVEIPGSVICIGSDYQWSLNHGAFEGCTNLTSVKIGDGVKSIGKGAFYGCTSLESVTIPGSVTEIEDGSYDSGAFANCTSLTSVKIGDGMTKIGEYAFYQCENLASVEIGNGVTSIGSDAFEKCTNLTSVTIPGSVTEIGSYAFSNCTLDTVRFGGTVAQWQALEGSSEINATCIFCTDGHIGVETVPDYLMMSGTKVTGYAGEVPANLVIPDGVTSIGIGAFEGCESLTTVTIPASVTAIASYQWPATTSAFSGCTNLDTVTYQGTLAQWCALGGNDRLMSYAKHVTMSDVTDLKTITNLVIPDGVTSIGSYAFQHCESLESVTIPASVKTIGGGNPIAWGSTSGAFSYCTNLASVVYGGTKDDCRNIEKGSSIFSDTNVTEITCKDGTFTVDSSGNITE